MSFFSSRRKKSVDDIKSFSGVSSLSSKSHKEVVDDAEEDVSEKVNLFEFFVPGAVGLMVLGLIIFIVLYLLQ